MGDGAGSDDIGKDKDRFWLINVEACLGTNNKITQQAKNTMLNIITTEIQ